MSALWRAHRRTLVIAILALGLGDCECGSPGDECAFDSDCASGLFCIDQTCQMIIGCDPTHKPCAAPTPVCIAATHECVECVADGDCEYGRCRTLDHRCVGCLS